MSAWFGRKDKNNFVTIVSGLPRSGTSLMMRMLDTGGLPPLMDGEREADADNPRGYYELERVKRLPKGDVAWVGDAKGKAVKVISALLVYLPPICTYRVIFMTRPMKEILASQRKMLERRTEDPDRVSDETLTGLFRQHLEEAEAWMAGREANLQVLRVGYNDIVSSPQPEIERVVEFLGLALDPAKMAGVVEPSLYRQRA
jgi:hypothetical protein